MMMNMLIDKDDDDDDDESHIWQFGADGFIIE